MRAGDKAKVQDLLDRIDNELVSADGGEVSRVLGEARSEGRTVFISSHQLPEVEHLCDRVGIIREGRLLAVESISALKERALRKLEIDFGGPVPTEAFANLPGVRDVTVDDGVLRCTVMGSLDGLVNAVASACCTLPAMGMMVAYSGTRQDLNRRTAFVSAISFMEFTSTPHRMAYRLDAWLPVSFAASRLVSR